MTSSLRTLTALLAVCALALGAAACGGGEDATKRRGRPGRRDRARRRAAGSDGGVHALMDRAEQGYKAQKREFPKVGSPEYQELKTRAVQFLVERYQYRARGRGARHRGHGGRGHEAARRDQGGELRGERREVRRRAREARAHRGGCARGDSRPAHPGEDLRRGDGRHHRDRCGDHRVLRGEREPSSRSRARCGTSSSRRRQSPTPRRSGSQDGASFAALAREFSTDETSAKQGGKLTVTKGQTAPEFDKLAFELDEGEVSDPVKTQFGWHIIEALEPISVTPLDEAKDTIRAAAPRPEEAGGHGDLGRPRRGGSTRRKSSTRSGYTPAADDRDRHDRHDDDGGVAA